MKSPGFYWYCGAEGDPPDMPVGEWQVVEVGEVEPGDDEIDIPSDQGVYLCGSDFPYFLSELHGEFHGPLQPPSKD